MEINWSTIGTVTGITAALIGLATAYLRLYVGSALLEQNLAFNDKLNQHKTDIVNHVTNTFALQATMIEKFDKVDVKFDGFNRRLEKIEKKVDG